MVMESSLLIYIIILIISIHRCSAFSGKSYIDPSKDLNNNVTDLDLSYCNLEEIPQNLRFYSNLINLNLSHNRLSILDGNSPLQHLTNLEKLDLTFNLFKGWENIKYNAFSNAKKLISLDFSNNSLKNTRELSNPLQSDSLKILKLNNCSMKHFVNTFRSLPNLEELHFAYNDITHINETYVSNSLKFIDLSNCKLKHIDENAFINLTKLDIIYLDRNNLKKFTCNSFSLKRLNLANCNLEVLPNGYLPKLNYASFHYNNFRNIPAFSFQNCINLQILDLSRNAIEFIDENAFRNLGKVVTINLSMNKLLSLSNSTFSSNLQLKSLNLSRNYFNKIETLIIRFLEVLDLSNCEIESIDQKSFVHMPSLTILNLSGNRISLLPDYFSGGKLRTLDVSQCRIKKLNNKTFANLPRLETLKLSGNRLTTVSPEFFINTRIKSLDLSDNLWRCECSDLKDIYKWLIQFDMNVNTLICQSPAIVEGKSWEEVCLNEWYPRRYKDDTVWWYTTGLIIAIFVIIFIIIIVRRLYMLKEKRLRRAEEERRAEEREALRRMRRIHLEAREEINRNAPDPRELQTPPAYNEALLLPQLDASHPSLSGSLHSLASKQSLHGSSTDISRKNRPRRKRRRRKSDTSDSQRASRTADSDTSEQETIQRTTLESDF